MLHSVKIRYNCTSYMQNDHNFTYAVYALMFLITFFYFRRTLIQQNGIVTAFYRVSAQAQQCYCYTNFVCSSRSGIVS